MTTEQKAGIPAVKNDNPTVFTQPSEPCMGSGNQSATERTNHNKAKGQSEKAGRNNSPHGCSVIRPLDLVYPVVFARNTKPATYGSILTMTTEWGATLALKLPVNEPRSLCSHKSRTLADK